MCLCHGTEQHRNIFMQEKSEKGDIEAVTKLLKIPQLAHHPTCNFYRNHLLYLFGKPFCLGCFCMSCGIFITTILFVLFNLYQYHPTNLFILGILIYIPTVFQVKYQKYFFKAFARFLLGGSVVLCLTSIFLLRNWFSFEIIYSLGYLTLFIIIYKTTQKFRAKNIDNPCKGCVKGHFPFCSWKVNEMKYLLEMEKEGKIVFSQAIHDILSISSKMLANPEEYNSSAIQTIQFSELNCEE